MLRRLLASAAAVVAPVCAACAVCVAGALAPAGAHAAAARAAAAPLPSRGSVRGTVVSVGWSSLTLRLGGRPMSVMGALTAAADHVAAGEYPYVWGGGHAAAGMADVGILDPAHHPGNGPGHNGRRVGYDCSGTVAAVLSGAGLWTAGTGVPSDAGIVSELRRAGVIAAGAGHGPASVTLWDHRGVHIFMAIGGRYFGTSDGGAGAPANPSGGAGWLDDGAPDTLRGAFRPFHVVAGALRGRMIYGPTLTLALRGPVADTAAALAVGTRVRVGYRTLHHVLVASSVS
jgi:hypothetical protein